MRRQILFGAAHALAAGYVAIIAASYLDPLARPTDSFITHLFFFAPLSMLMLSWFIVPVGVVLGIALPRLVSRRSARQACLVGGAIGVMIGIVAALVACAFTQTGISGPQRYGLWSSIVYGALSLMFGTAFVSTIWVTGNV